MSLKMYLHPLSTYCQKAETAFYEKGIAFEPRLLDGDGPVSRELAALWPVGRFPVVDHDGKLVFEATSIIDYLDARFPDAPRLIPADPLAAADVRMWDRFFDNYINYPLQRIVFAAIGREPGGEEMLAKWHSAFDNAYAVLDAHMQGRSWASGDFSLADCAAAPALLYADWAYAIPAKFEAVHAYRARLLARPSYARALDEARPYRDMFPLGAPDDRD